VTNSALNRSGCLLLAIWLSPLLMAEPVREPFVPNHVAVEDVILSSPNGNARGRLARGTLVAAREMDDVLDVKTEKGGFGLAHRRSFSRLGSSIQITEETRTAAESSNQFAFDLHRQLRTREGNLFYSPASVWTALAMTCAGARGTTRREMATVLHLDAPRDVEPGISSLLDVLNSTGDRNGYSLATANRLWGAADYAFETDFLHRTRATYRAELKTLDFTQPEPARRTINRWTADQTRGKIVDLIPPGILEPDTRLVLTNAIYFAGGWSFEFPKSATKLAPFFLSRSQRIEVPTMEQRRELPYAEDEEAQVLALPYRDHELSLIVILPRSRGGLGHLEAQLTHQRFQDWVRGLRTEHLVEVYLPKFTLRSDFLLSEVLGAAGLKSAFSADADFSGISRQEALMISEVVHQAFVDVDEAGTEAAAATAVVMAPTAAIAEPGPPPKPVIFRADHPFLLAIRDDRSGAVLFLARVQRPVE